MVSTIAANKMEAPKDSVEMNKQHHQSRKLFIIDLNHFMERRKERKRPDLQPKFPRDAK